MDFEVLGNEIATWKEEYHFLWEHSLTTMASDSPTINSFTPGLFLPLYFEESCPSTTPPKDYKNNVLNPPSSKIGFVCRGSDTSIGGTTCHANCAINPIGMIPSLMYWYLLSCLTIYAINEYRNKKWK